MLDRYTPQLPTEEELEIVESDLEELVEEIIGDDKMKYKVVPIEIAVQRLKNLFPVASCFILGIIYYVHSIAY